MERDCQHGLYKAGMGSSRVLSDFAEKYGSKNRVLAGFGIGGKSGKEKVILNKMMAIRNFDVYEPLVENWDPFAAQTHNKGIYIWQLNVPTTRRIQLSLSKALAAQLSFEVS
ncbi:hypothetical protein Tco_0881241 [Tanacetum coccineum]